MAKSIIKAGICGFTTSISAESEDEQNITIRIESDCPNIRKLADSLPVLDAYSEIHQGFDGELLKAARANLKSCCAGCAVPAGIFKTMQVAAGLALPQSVSIEIKAD